MTYNAIVTLGRRHAGAELADQVHGGDLDAYGAVTGADSRGRAQIILTIEAADVAQAAATARALLAGFSDQVRVEVMTTEEYDRGDVEIPALVSVTEAAELLGVTRQAVLQRISSGSLPARQVGKGWVIPAAAAEAAS